MTVPVSISQHIRNIFQQQFGQSPVIVRSPGRINLIGEHTDYNMGFVLPAAIDKAVYIAIAPGQDDVIRLVAADLDQSYQSALQNLQPSPLQWPDFVLGVVDQLIRAGHSIKGFDAVIMGDVPLGAGLSSSAAVECATVFALNTVFDLKLPALKMVQTAQKAENEFVGVKCGIMDPFASMFGKEGHVIQLDCRSLEYAYMPFATKDIKIVLLDTGVKHSLASSEYNLRRGECEAGVNSIRKKYPEVQTLRDATLQMIDECLAIGDDKIYRRCKYIVEEITRLQDACNDLVNHDLPAFGQKMFATHEGLSKLYEVSCPEADALVEWVRHRSEVLGARMMGGGFGGCTINIVLNEGIEPLVADMEKAYMDRFNRVLKSYVVSIENGTSLVTI